MGKARPGECRVPEIHLSTSAGPWRSRSTILNVLGSVRLIRSEPVMNAPGQFKLKLSPLSRLYFTLDRELSLDKSFLADAARYDRLIRMHETSERKRDILIAAK